MHLCQNFMYIYIYIYMYIYIYAPPVVLVHRGMPPMGMGGMMPGMNRQQGPSSMPPKPGGPSSHSAPPSRPLFPSAAASQVKCTYNRM